MSQNAPIISNQNHKIIAELAKQARDHERIKAQQPFLLALFLLPGVIVFVAAVVMGMGGNISVPAKGSGFDSISPVIYGLLMMLAAAVGAIAGYCVSYRPIRQRKSAGPANQSTVASTFPSTPQTNVHH